MISVQILVKISEFRIKLFLFLLILISSTRGQIVILRFKSFDFEC